MCRRLFPPKPFTLQRGKGKGTPGKPRAASGGSMPVKFNPILWRGRGLIRGVREKEK